MQKLKAFFKARPYAIILLYWPIHYAYYAFLNLFAPSMNEFVLHSALDDLIPFEEIFVLPYLLWFFYIASSLTWFLIKSKKDFLQTSCMLYTGFFISMVVCTVFPCTHDLRPAVFPRENLLTDLVRALYGFDNPSVIFPSMHVLISILLCIALWKSDTLGKKLWVRIGSVTLSTLICLATVFIKQHSIYDFFAALVLVLPITLFTYKFVFGKLLKPQQYQ